VSSKSSSAARACFLFLFGPQLFAIRFEFGLFFWRQRRRGFVGFVLAHTVWNRSFCADVFGGDLQRFSPFLSCKSARHRLKICHPMTDFRGEARSQSCEKRQFAARFHGRSNRATRHHSRATSRRGAWFHSSAANRVQRWRPLQIKPRHVASRGEFRRANFACFSTPPIAMKAIGEPIIRAVVKDNRGRQFGFRRERFGVFVDDAFVDFFAGLGAAIGANMRRGELGDFGF
jgi:hypothetical protein